MGRNIKKDAIDQTTYIRIVDSTDGTPETGVVAATSGLDLEYVRLGGTPTDLTESDLAATNSAHSDGGIKHVGGGVYRVDLPDAACATGVDQVSVQGTCTGMVVLGISHQLVDLSLSGQSAVDLKDFADAGYDPTTNTITGIFGTINTFDELTDGAPELNLDGSGNIGVWSMEDGTIADADFASDVRVGIDWAQVANPTTSNVLSSTTIGTLTTYTGNTPQTGDSFARIGATGSGLSSLAPASTALSTAQWSNTRAGYIDNLSAGAAATASTQSTQGTILDKLNAAFASSGVFSTGALQNAPTGSGEGGGLSPAQDASLTAIENRVTLGVPNAAPGSGTGAATFSNLADIDIDLDPVQTVVGAIKLKTDNLPADPADQSALISAIDGINITPTDPQIQTLADALVAAGVGRNITPVNQVPVPQSRTWKLKTGNTGLIGELPITIKVSDTAKLFAIDFSADLPNNGRVTLINSVAIQTGTAGGVTFGADLEEVDDYGVDRAQAKVRITPATAGTYIIRVSVDYAGGDGGGSAEGDVKLVVVP